ncbi:MAG: hypothetical protein ACO3P8_01705 [Steroidobacteraceae bacterium]
MSVRKRNRFYWLEGVSEKEVVQSLNDTRPSRLRSRGVRRALVLTNSALLAVLALQILLVTVMPEALQSYFSFAALAGCIVTYLCLRKSVRQISDAPNALLDERQIAVRDAAYTMAYRLLSVLTVAYLTLFIVADRHADVEEPIELFLSLLMCAASLPAMVLAWTLPAEQDPLEDDR